MKKFINGLLTAVTIAGIALGAHPVAAESKGEFDGKVVKVGVVNESNEQAWNEIAKRAKEEAGIEIKIELFNDYIQPNVALKDGSIDMNAYQGYPFFFAWQRDNDAKFASIGNTIIAPLGLYSEKHKSIDELPDGATIGIPNDPSTYGRAFQALEALGFIKYDHKAGIFPEEKDLLENKKNLKFKLLDPGHAVLSLQDIDASFINSGFAIDGGLKLSDAIYIESENLDKFNIVYTNLIAVREEDKDNPLYKKVVEFYQTPENAANMLKFTKGGEIPVFDKITVDDVYKKANAEGYFK